MAEQSGGGGRKNGFFTAWLQCKLSFSLVKSALLCLRGPQELTEMILEH